MKTDLYIPKTITVGYVSRPDTFTGKLAYVIYTDHKGKLRKQTSWENWRDKNIEVETFDNTPQPNFTFNKGIQRDGHWGSGRSKIRVWDPRNFEMEIEVDNLIGILMHSDVSKRDIVEPCVYAWHGADLVLLPTNSVEYQESVTHTDKQGMKVGAKELGIGYTYEIKTDRKQVVYLGRFPTYDMVSERAENWGSSLTSTQVDKKPQHVFINPETGAVEFKSPTQYLAQVVSEECHPQYAELMDTFYKLYSSQPMIGVKLVPNNFPDVRNDDFLKHYKDHDSYTQNLGYYACSNGIDHSVKGNHWIQFDETRFIEICVEIDLHPSSHYAPGPQPPKYSVTYSRVAVYDPAERRVRFSNPGATGYYGRNQPKLVLEDFNERTPGVAERINGVHNDFTEALVGWVPMHHGAAPLTEDILHGLERLIAVARAHNFGDLYAILQNSHVSKTQIY
jgi:hypothetical protein